MPKSQNSINRRRKERVLRAFAPYHVAKEKGEVPILRIKHGTWINALETPPFGTGKYTWQLTVTFPFKMEKDAKMEQFKEAIQRAFETIFFP